MSLRYITMPKWGIEMQQGTLTEWHVKEGEAVEKGQLIALVETDKITNEMEADAPGVLLKALVPEGEVRIVGELLAVMGDADVNAADVEAFIAAFEAPDTSMAGANSSPSEDAAVTVKTEPKPAAISTTDFDGVNISPAAKNLAISLGIQPNTIVATGRRGRISLQDVEQAAAAQGLGRNASAADGSNAEVPNDPDVMTMSNLRKTAAKRLTEAKSTIPHFYLRIQANIDELLASKKGYQENNSKVSLNDILIKAAAAALTENPDVNIQIHGDDIHKFPHADIAVAVATEKGLVTPLVKRANLKPLSEVSSDVTSMAGRAREGKLTHNDMGAGTFTISNLGMFGVNQFDAIINPPQCAILAVGTSTRVWTEDDKKKGGFSTMLSLSLSCDHRAIDGATGAAFLKSLKQHLEAPSSLFGANT